MASVSSRPLPVSAGVRRMLVVCALALWWAPLADALHDHDQHAGRADGGALQCGQCASHGAAAPGEAATASAERPGTPHALPRSLPAAPGLAARHRPHAARAPPASPAG